MMNGLSITIPSSNLSGPSTPRIEMNRPSIPRPPPVVIPSAPFATPVASPSRFTTNENLRLVYQGTLFLLRTVQSFEWKFSRRQFKAEAPFEYEQAQRNRNVWSAVLTELSRNYPGQEQVMADLARYLRSSFSTRSSEADFVPVLNLVHRLQVRIKSILQTYIYGISMETLHDIWFVSQEQISVVTSRIRQSPSSLTSQLLPLQSVNALQDLQEII